MYGYMHALNRELNVVFRRMHQVALNASPSTCLVVLALGVHMIREHPECLSLLHRTKPTHTRFDSKQGENLEQTHALESSLWEIEALQHHYLHNVADMAETIQKSKESTTISTKAVVLDMDYFFGQTYSSMFTQEAKRRKKQGALAFHKPHSLFQPTNDLLEESFTFVTRK